MSATTTALNLVAEYREADAKVSELGRLDCGMQNLRFQLDTGNTRPWIAASVAENGYPTDERLAQVTADRAYWTGRRNELRTATWRALLEAGLAFEIIDHSDRLEDKPYEVRCSEVFGAWFNANGAMMRRARYATREAAERMVARTTAKELARGT